MGREGIVGFSDADQATLSEIAHAVAQADAVIAAGKAQLTRALARAEKLARDQSASSPRRVRDHDMAQRAIALELGARSRVSDRTMQRRMNAAATLANDYPRTLDALAGGRIHEGHVRLIVDTGTVLPADARRAFETEAVRRCETDTPGRVRAGLQILAERLHPRTLTERHAEAREDRRVFLTPLADGMSHLGIIVPTIIGEGIYDRATRMARALTDFRTGAAQRLRESRAAGLPDDPENTVHATDTRTIDQLRADLLADTALTGDPATDPTRTGDGPGALGAIRAHVQVVVPVLTLLGTDDSPADLAGRAPIDADTARRLAGGSTTGWDRILTHPITGQVLAVDRRDIPPALRRQITGRDQHCRAPGCAAPAIRCEIDHIRDWAHGGPTHTDNLHSLCQRHHSMKQFTAWHVRMLDRGTIQWTSPLGTTYTDQPRPPAVHFTPDDPHSPYRDLITDTPRDDEPPPWENSA
ncbi:HNH endonuclease [Microbacterium sp. cx-55]|uniref:HNH endonuclease signature motif containing protein n=1 Tax=Microbacterium sp. cx-55 TaxID=2875948 RepID=UPI001CBBE5FC|nr:HNH endonuclease signature motif containing protein [Microbacterium sp. cx-55]MBZ4486544.1 HNH endonuclease [Microbacterium sp. cx-55]UGB36488.1 HNH endonuclease [Microbacterium sp. cx-55]